MALLWFYCRATVRQGVAAGKQVACLLAGEAIRHMPDCKLSMPREKQQVNARDSLVSPDSLITAGSSAMDLEFVAYRTV